MEIEPERARELLDEGRAVFVDIRDPESHRAARIPGAVHVDDGTVESFLESADPSRPVVVYCYHGISSRGGAAYFREHGLAEVYSLIGGFEDWRAAGRPCEGSE